MGGGGAWSAIVVVVDVVVVVGSTGLHPLYSPLPKALPAQLIQTAYNFEICFLNSSWQSIDLFVEQSHFARVFLRQKQVKAGLAGWHWNQVIWSFHVRNQKCIPVALFCSNVGFHSDCSDGKWWLNWSTWAATDMQGSTQVSYLILLLPFWWQKLSLFVCLGQPNSHCLAPENVSDLPAGLF